MRYDIRKHQHKHYVLYTALGMAVQTIKGTLARQIVHDVLLCFSTM